MSTTVDIASRKNLAQISKMLAQITSGAEFGDESPAYIPVNDYVRKSIAQITAWLLQGMSSGLYLCLRSLTTVAVADVSDAETEFHAHEFLDATIQPRPIWISPNEVYSMHTLLSQQLDHLVCLIASCLSSHLISFVGTGSRRHPPRHLSRVGWCAQRRQ